MVQLTRLGRLNIYAEDAAGATSRCVFFIPRNATNVQVIALDQALAGGGALVLTPATRDFNLMLAAGAKLLDGVREHAVIAWYSASDGPPGNARRLEISQNGDIRKFIPGNYVEKALGSIEAVRARMRWAPTAAATKARVVVKGDSIALLCKPGESPFQCVINATNFPLLRTPAQSGYEQLAAIQFTGDLQSGSWLFSIAPQGALGALKYFMPGMSYVFEDEGGYGNLVSENFPVFDLNGTDPLKGVDALAIGVNAYDIGSAGNYIELQSASAMKLSVASNFVTRRGGQVTLKAANARMHFTPNENANSFTLSPVGVFELEAPSTAFDARRGIKVVDLLTGSAGTEFITFAAGPGNSTLPGAIEFVDGCAAFAKKSAGGFELNSQATTSYVRPSWSGASGHQEFSYVAQSEEAPLFEAPVASAAAQLFAVPAGLSFAPKPRTVDAVTGLMPWLPMRNAERSSAMQFDRVVTGVARRRIAGKTQRSYQALGRQAGDWTVTPQGFFVQVDDEGYWQTIRIAAGQGDAISVEFGRPENAARWRLEEALSRPASFLVASRSPQSAPQEPPELGEFRIAAHDWKLSCNFAAVPSAAVDAKASPLLIVKFGPGTVLDLLGKTENWSLADEFNASPTQAQADVLRAVEGLKDLSQGRSPLPQGASANLPQDVQDAYGRLLAKLSDPKWNGVLLFNAGSSLKQLPAAVAALASGESQSFDELFVPVMGVDISRVGENLTQKSSLFGAVHFFDFRQVTEPADKGYTLKLRNLDTHIENSSITSFVAKAQLWVGTLMGDPLTGTSGGEPIINIEGRYEGKSSAGDEPRYVVKALGRQNLLFANTLLESIEVNRLELVSTRPEKDLIIGRISLWGNVVLGSEVVRFSGVKSVKFGDLAITLKQRSGGSPSFGFDAGSISVDWDSGAEAAVTGWLKSFPLRLSGFRWSGMGSMGGMPDAKPLNWPDIGFSTLDLDLPSLPSMKAPDFDFGLEFDLNLGGFGGMTDAAKILRAKLLLGWQDFRRGILSLDARVGLGFRFEGGSSPLDVGVQGVFRLRAKRVILKTYANNSLIGFGLDEPRLDILGYEIPKEAKVQLAIVVEAKRPASQPTWIFVSYKFGASPLFLEYFAIGQNVLLLDPAAQPTSASSAVEMSKGWVSDSFGKEELGRLRPTNPRGNKWGLVAAGTLKNIVKFDLAFMDEISLYGLKIEIPEGKPFFTADVLYRKISDDLGMFSVEIDPKWPSLEIGVGSLTLPILGFDRLTNGGGGINLGFNGNNFSKAGTFQAIPFLGSLGVKMGQYTGLSSAFLLAGASPELVKRYEKLDLSPVHEIQLAFRLGFGKEIRQSIFRAGVSLTVYGLFQGAIGKVKNPPAENPIAQYIKIAGAAGILLEIFGAIDFALISASVSIRVWVEVGFIVETWQPIEIYGEAGVSVYVKFVIARFKVFGTSFEIAVHYSFATTVRFGTQLNERLGGTPPKGYETRSLPRVGPAALVGVQPIDWQVVKLDPNKEWALPLVPSMDLAANDAGGSSVVPLLAVHNPAPHGRASQVIGDSVMDLVTGLFRWAVRLHLGSPQADPASITYEELELLQARLRSAGGYPASRWMAQDLTGAVTQPLDVSAIKSFFELNFRFTLLDSQKAKAQIEHLFPSKQDANKGLQAIVFPWLREVEIYAIPQNGNGGASRPLRIFHQAQYEVVTPAWEDNLKTVLKKGRPEYPPLNNEQLLIDDARVPAGRAVPNKAALDLMLEDWVGAVLEAVVGDALTLVPAEGDKPIQFQALLTELTSDQKGIPPALQAAQRASSVLLHGLRVPKADLGGWTSIARFADFDIDFSNTADPAALHDAENVDLRVGGAKNKWLAGAASLQIKSAVAAQEAAVLAKAMQGQTLDLNIALAEHQSNPDDGGNLAVVIGPGSQPKLLNMPAGVVARLFSVPQRLQDEVSENKGPLAVTFKRFAPFSSPKSPESLPGAPASSSISFAGLFNLRLRKVRAATTSSPGLVAISGAGEQARQILASWERDPTIAPDSFRFVVPGAKSEPPSFITQGVQFFTTNLSTEANPDAVSMRMLDGTSPVLVDISDAANMRRFLWMASVVNDTGFYASIGGHAWAALEQQLFKDSDIADASIAWLRKAFNNADSGVIGEAETLVIVEAPAFPEDLALRIVVPSIPNSTSAAPAGFVSLVVTRPYTENDPAHPNDGTELLSRYVFLEHSVSVNKQPMLTFDESPALPPEPPDNLDVKEPFAAQAATELKYCVSVPLSKFMPAAAAASGPVLSPYMFIGKDLSQILGFGLRDASGHRFPGKIGPKWASSVMLFRNSLPHLGTLPGLSLTWTPIAAGTFRVDLSFARPADFLAGEGLVGVYRDLKFNFDTTHVTLQLEVALRDGALPQPAEAVVHSDPGIQAVVRQMVEDILNPRKPAVTSWSFQFKVPPAKISAELKTTPREVSVRLRLARVLHVDPDAVKVNPAVRETVAVVRPAVADSREAWRAFAEDMEKALPATFMAKMSRGSGGSVVWLGNAALLDAPFSGQFDLQSFAPMPLSNQFRSGEAVMLDEYGVDAPDAPRKEAGNVDLDLLMEQSFDLFEEVLEPGAAAKLAAFAPDSFVSLMESKRSMVQTFKRRLHPIEDKKLAGTIDLAQVEKRFHSLGARDLRAIYKLGAIAMVRNPNPNPNPNAVLSKPRIFGQVFATGVVSAVEWSKIRLPLQSDALGVISASWKPDARVASVPFPSSVAPSHIEWPWPGSETDEYAPSRWLELLSARSLRERKLKMAVNADVPLPLRRLPPTPKVYGHQGTAATVVLHSVSDVRRWTYQLDVAVPSEAQDTVKIGLDYLPNPTFTVRNQARSLFDSLVGIAHHRDALAGYLSQLKSDGASPDVIKKLGQYFERFFADLALTLDAHDPAFSATRTVSPHTDDLKVNISVLENKDTLLTQEFRTLGNRQARVELALIDAGRSPFAVVENPIYDLNRTTYRDTEDARRATRGIAGLSGRRATVTGLDILNQPIVMPSVSAFRNEKLGGVKVDPAFILATPESKSSTELVVHLTQPAGRLQISTAAATLAHHLRAFADALFGVDGANVTVDADAALVIPLDKGGKQTFSSPLGVLKGSKPENGSFSAPFLNWGSELAAALGMGAVDPETPPQGLQLSVTVYANYAGDLPVLVLPRLWIVWRHITPESTNSSIPTRTFDSTEIIESLYWLTGGWRPDSQKKQTETRKLRKKIAHLLQSSPCYNYLPLASTLRSRERDAQGMAAAWRECADIVAANSQLKKPVRPSADVLGWFVAPLDQTTGEPERDAIRRLSNGPFLPQVEWEMKTSDPIDSVWRAPDDPFSTRSVVLVEIVEKQGGGAADGTIQAVLEE